MAYSMRFLVENIFFEEKLQHKTKKIQVTKH